MLLRSAMHYRGGLAPAQAYTGFAVRIVTAAPSTNFRYTLYLPDTIIVDFGDGSLPLTHFSTGTFYYTYAEAGTYVLQFSGHCHGIDFYTGGGTPQFIVAVLSPLRRIAGLTLANQVFRNATELTEVPSDIVSGLPLCTQMGYAFAGCSKLGVIPDLSDTEQCAYFDAMFHNCSLMTGVAPALWSRSPTPAGALCFHNCTALSNYGDIPGSWR